MVKTDVLKAYPILKEDYLDLGSLASLQQKLQK
jgi:hypothetical protein